MRPPHAWCLMFFFWCNTLTDTTALLFLAEICSLADSADLADIYFAHYTPSNKSAKSVRSARDKLLASERKWLHAIRYPLNIILNIISIEVHKYPKLLLCEL